MEKPVKWTDPPVLFSLSATRELGERIAQYLEVPLSEHEERDFEDGEHKARPLVSVRGRDVYVIQSLYGGENETVNDKICRLLFFLGAMREGGAARVTAVIPYLAYASKDRQTKPRDPVTTRYVALLLAAVGVGVVIALDVHNIVAFQNAFRCRTEHLDPRRLFAEHMRERVGEGPLVVASPAPGGVHTGAALSGNVRTCDWPRCRNGMDGEAPERWCCNREPACRRCAGCRRARH